MVYVVVQFHILINKKVSQNVWAENGTTINMEGVTYFWWEVYYFKLVCHIWEDAHCQRQNGTR
jgi:hypothetical protein